MARISLRCECGWTFFITASTQGHEVTCSSCGAPVPIPGRKPGDEVLTPGELAARIRQQAQTKKMIAGIVGGVVVIALLLVFWFSGGDEPVTTGATGSNPARVGANPVPPPPPPPPPAIDIPLYRSMIYNRIRDANLSGIAAEALLLKGRSDKRAPVIQQMVANEAEILSLKKKLDDAKAYVDMPERLMPGDRILSLNGRPVADVPKQEGWKVLEEWLARLKAPSDNFVVIVSRGERKVSVTIGFPDLSPKLLDLARLPARWPADPSRVPPEPKLEPAPPKPAPALMAFESALLHDIAARFKMLGPGYREFLAAKDRSRLDALVKAGKGTPADRQFLTTIQRVVLPRFEADAGAITSARANIKAKLDNMPAAVDALHFKSPAGRKVTGKILKVTETEVRIELKFGTVTYQRKEILRIDEGGGPGKEFAQRFEKDKGDAKALEALLRWCYERELKTEREYVGLVLLGMNPAHPEARTAAGKPRPAGMPLFGPSGQAPPGPQPQPGGVPSAVTGTITYKDKEWAPVELRDYLIQREKRVLVDGRWYRGKKTDYSVRNISKQRGNPAVTILSTSAALLGDLEGVRKGSKIVPAALPYEPKEHFYSPSYVVRSASSSRFAAERSSGSVRAAPAGSMLGGEVQISVRLDGPLLEGAVKIKADVKSGGFVTVYLQSHGQRVRLYDITRDEYKSRPIPAEHILGSTRLDLVAEMKMQAQYTERVQIKKITLERIVEQVPVYTAKLFPSSVHTTEVFLLRAVVGVPVPHLDKLFERHPHVLR